MTEFFSDSTPYLCVRTLVIHLIVPPPSAVRLTCNTVPQRFFARPE